MWISPPLVKPSAPSRSCLARRSSNARSRFSSLVSLSLRVRRVRAAGARPAVAARVAVDEAVPAVADVRGLEVAVLVAVAVE